MPSKSCNVQFKNVNFSEQCEKALYNSEVVYNFESLFDILGQYLLIHDLDGSFALEQVDDSAGESKEHEDLSVAGRPFTSSSIGRGSEFVLSGKGKTAIL